MRRSVPYRISVLGLATTVAMTALAGVRLPARADDAPAPAGPWLANQAMGVALASVLAAAKSQIAWTKGLGLDDSGPCIAGVHLAKGSSYGGALALKKDVKYRVHGYAGTTAEVELTLLDGDGRKVAGSTPRDDAGAVLLFKPKADGPHTLRMSYAGSAGGAQACAYAVLRDGGAPITATTVGATMMNLVGRLNTLPESMPGAHFVAEDGRLAALGAVFQPKGSRTLERLDLPAGSHAIVAMADSAATDLDLSVVKPDGSKVEGAEDPATGGGDAETVQFDGAGPFAVTIANGASAGPNFVLGILVTTSGAAVPAPPAEAGGAADAVPAYAKPMFQAVKHAMSLSAFLADEIENRLADGPSIMGGVLRDGQSFRAPRILLPGITYTIVAAGDEGVGKLQLRVYDLHGAPMGQVVESGGYAYVTFKPDLVDNIYTVEVKQVKSTGGRHACAALTFRQAGAGISAADVQRGLTNLAAELQKVGAAEAASFNDMGGQVSLYGTLLREQESRTFEGVGLAVGNHVFLATSDGGAKDLDLVVTSNDGTSLAKDTGSGATPMTSYNGVGTVNVKLICKKATQPSMTMLSILNVGPAK